MKYATHDSFQNAAVTYATVHSCVRQQTSEKLISGTSRVRETHEHDAELFCTVSGAKTAA